MSLDQEDFERASSAYEEAQEKIKELEEENKRLNRKLEYAIGYTANALMEHNVSAAFIKNYTEQYGEDEWVNIAYVKEIFQIIAMPKPAIINTEETKK